jgi:hypothetical protein
MADEMMASEAAEKLLELVNEFGDWPLVTADALQPTWRNPVYGIEYEHDGDQYLLLND